MVCQGEIPSRIGWEPGAARIPQVTRSVSEGEQIDILYITPLLTLRVTFGIRAGNSRRLWKLWESTIGGILADAAGYLGNLAFAPEANSAKYDRPIPCSLHDKDARHGSQFD